MLLSVFLCAAAVLAFEVLLTRLFAITQWHHLSFMVISIAMLGTAASGVFVRAAGDRRLAAERLLPAAVVLLPPALLFGFQAAARTRLDYFALAVDPLQLARLCFLFVVLACPFALAGFVTALAYAERRPASVYLASMAGSALGALAPAALLPAAGLARAFVLVAILPSAAALTRAAARRGEGWLPLAIAGASLPFAAVLLALPALIEVQPNEYKALRHLEATPGVVVTARHDRLRARYDEVEGRGVRFAPGLSLRYTDALPGQKLILEDGDRRHLLLDPEDPRCDPFARSLLAYGATLVPPTLERALILHADGGAAAAAARAAGARAIDLVTDQPYLARRFAEHYAGLTRSVVRASPRAFLLNAGDSYDLIQVESLGTQLPAMASLAEDHWLTVEALQAMLWRLAPGGVLAFNRALDLPPNDLLRLLSTAWQALGVEAPQRHTAALRSWDTLLLVVSREPLGAQARQRLRGFAERMRFDLVQMEGLTAEEANRYNQMARPFHFEAAQALAAAALDRQSPFDVSALTDARPFPYHYLRWTRLPAAWRLFGDRLFSLMLSGEVMLMLVLATAVLASALILLVPARLGRRAPRGGPSPAAWFAAVGAGYMFCEIGWLHALGLLLESPSLAFAAAVGGLLLASGPGGMAGERGARLRPTLAAAALVTLVLAAACAPATRWLLALGPGPRAAVALAALLPCGLLMGIPFPLGLRRLVFDGPAEHRAGRLAQAWAANGSASVVASVVAPVVAMSWGNATLFACAAVCYGAALAAAVPARRRAARGLAPPGGPP